MMLWYPDEYVFIFIDHLINIIIYLRGWKTYNINGNIILTVLKFIICHKILVYLVRKTQL